MQSHYFASMFSGNWKESDQVIIHLDIPDPNITEECMNTITTLGHKVYSLSPTHAFEHTHVLT